ncbi:MAG: alpha/beta fold hydrolase [Actinomycetia bacterium]|nr:alpha/beta fold hydrolase [Actinomycetes bacterium]
MGVGDTVSAREAFFRASSYYRSAEFYRREDPLNDPQVLELSRPSKDDYTLTADDVLILEGEDDKVFAGQAAKVAAELRAPHEHVVMRDADGAGEHCHEGAMYLLHQTR